MISKRLYITIIALVALAVAVVFNTFPRSTFSALEKRELATFPAFSWERLADGSFTSDVSSWFSDSEPYRDVFMEVSMQLKHWMRISLPGEEQVTFHASTKSIPESSASAIPDSIGEMAQTDSLGSQEIIDGSAKIANAGIIIVGSGPDVRALMAFGGTGKGNTAYPDAANLYYNTFNGQVRVYCMVIPTAIEFYCPEKVRSHTRSQKATIDNFYAHLAPGVKGIDALSALAPHVHEDIYLRTDHHWAPLGAYYAAREFAAVAGVPFRDLSAYDQKVIHRYVGSMYGYSQDIAVKNAPEDFVYYVPRGADYSVTYITYTIDEEYHVTSESKPRKGPYFYHQRDGSGNAYCTFMGSDTKITQVRTGIHNGRRLLILKDSFGNAIPGYMFFSFEEVHVVDYRYFTKNMTSYVEDHYITDILFANNVFSACSPHTGRTYARYLTQKGGIVVHHKTDSLQEAKPAVPQDTIESLITNNESK